MNTIRVVFSIIIVTIYYGATFSCYADSLPTFSIVTEDRKPYNFEENGVVKGISVDLLVLILKRIGSHQTRHDIKIYPWARAYKILQEQPNTILFTTILTKERENMFKWVGPIIQDITQLYALKSKNIKITSPSELKKYRIATYLDDSGEQILVKEYGLSLDDLHRSASQIAGLRRVYYGRNDLFVGNQPTLEHLSKKAGFNSDEFEPVFVLHINKLCYAFHYDTSDDIIELFQQALDRLKKEGEVDKIFEKYQHM